MRPAFSHHGSRSSASSTSGSVRATKYGNIKASIDSGINMRKLNEKYPEAKISILWKLEDARFKKEENFRRMKLSTLLRLLDEKQIGCLILDIRDKDEFQACHMKGAISYPAPLLRRSVNVFTVEILSFEATQTSFSLLFRAPQMNKEPDKIIIFYDEDEHTGASTGNLFVEKGVENIFMLSGGKKTFLFLFFSFALVSDRIETDERHGPAKTGLKEVATKCRDMIEGSVEGRFPMTTAAMSPFSRLSTASSPSRMSSNSSRMSSRMSSRFSTSSRIRV
ncbi:hypothetical protein SELMODRAFT_428883 [Selaginella moellendorffii]|uniref:Rhodanese domain-containing protein n=1 Tax=Selaginella moellendorffii TaxID=88036 RepID=D8T4B1_SELML|nr:hypothetical protein SELMODRAFT_428883 [Selaginella moellendorffii]